MDKKVTLKLIRKPAKEKDAKGNIVELPGRFVQDDVGGLFSLLNKFDTRRYSVDKWKTAVQLKNILIDMMVQEGLEITLDLTLDQSTFLREYLTGFKEKEGKDTPLNDFEQRTYFSVLEQIS